MLTKVPLRSKNQTGDAMYDLCTRYNSDLEDIYLNRGRRAKPISELSIKKYYNFVRDIPYQMDQKPIEVIGRPLRIIEFPKLDCKKKSVLIGSYAAYHKIPYRFVASSSRPDKRIHHVYPELFIGDRFINFDATYSDYYIGKRKFTTAKEYL